MSGSNTTIIMMTNNPLHTILQTVRDLQAQEVVLGGSNVFLADEQMEQVAFFWITINGGETKPLTVRILSRDRDVYFDLGGGNRIPKISERRARSVKELRAGGVGVDRVLLIHQGRRGGKIHLSRSFPHAAARRRVQARQRRARHS